MNKNKQTKQTLESIDKAETTPVLQYAFKSWRNALYKIKYVEVWKDIQWKKKPKPKNAFKNILPLMRKTKYLPATQE